MKFGNREDAVAHFLEYLKVESDEDAKSSGVAAAGMVMAVAVQAGLIAPDTEHLNDGLQRMTNLLTKVAVMSFTQKLRLEGQMAQEAPAPVEDPLFSFKH